MKLATNSRGKVVCAWFAGCTREADGYVTHPTLGAVPSCYRCADHSGSPFTEAEIELIIDSEGHTSTDAL